MRRTTVSRSIILAAVLATTLLIGVKSSTAQVELRLAEACVAGYPAACTRLVFFQAEKNFCRVGSCGALLERVPPS